MLLGGTGNQILATKTGPPNRQLRVFMHKSLLSIAAITAFAATVPASASTVILTGSSTASGHSLLYTSGSVNFSATALTYTDSLTPSVSTAVKYAEGLGVNPSGDNRHTIDNSGAYDFILLRFDHAVALNGATFANLNWYNDARADTDATISYATFNYDAFGQSYATNLTGGAKTNFFNAVSTSLYNNAFGSDTNTSGTSSRTFNAGAQPNVSDVWIIGASITNFDHRIDSFKLKSVSYNMPAVPVGSVPEPATWALLILGMGVVGAGMRRNNRVRLAFA